MADNQNPNNPGNPNDPYRSEMPQYPTGYGAGPGGFSTQPADDEELDSGMPSVASSPGRVMVVLGIAALAIGGVLYSLFSGDEKKAPDATIDLTKTGKATSVPQPSTPVPPPPIDTLPVQQQTDVVPPPPAPSLPPPPPPPTPQMSANDKNRNAQQFERRKSPMMAYGGRATSNTPQQKKVTGFGGRDPNLVFSREYLEDTGADQAQATLMGNMNYLVAQGKVIDAVLETAINTDLPGPLRAIVSRDIFAESGREVLIPKGSRLIGSYNSSLKRGQSRVYVIWSRVIRPDGIDIKIDSPGIDQLGRAGIEGYVDNKYFEMFASAFLTSSVTVTLGIAADQLLDDNGTSSTNTSDGTTTSSGSAGGQAVLQGINDFSDTTTDIVKEILEQQPTITVDQGTRIKVFVQRDLVMPPAVLDQLRFIQ